MEKDWPPLEECYQYKLGMLDGALRRYPWEDDGYAFDFDSYHPPIPDELACIRKLLDSLKKNGSRPSSPEDTRNCPFCTLRRGALAQVDILNHPVWDMDPIPCPVHLKNHIWCFGDEGPSIITPKQLENTKKYLNQVRNSRGYDVDCAPHPDLGVPRAFLEISISKISDNIKAVLESTVMDHIEMKTEKKYVLDKILKIVATNNNCRKLVTFTAKVMNDYSAASETFIATLFRSNIMECLLKPDGNAPGPDHYPVYEIRPISIPNFMRDNMRNCDPQLVFNYGAHRGVLNPGFVDKPIFPTPGKDTSSAAAPASSVPCPSSGSKRSPEAGPISFFKRNRRVTEAMAKGWKASSRAAPMVDLDPKAAKEHPMRYLGKKQPSASTAEEMLTTASFTFSEFGGFPVDLVNTLLSEYQNLKVRLIEEQMKNFQLFTGQAKLREEVEKWKSQACSLSMDMEAHLKGVRTCRESYLKSQAGVTPKDLSPLDPSIFPLQHVEAEPLQTLPPVVEENRDEGSGSSVHVKETSPNPEAENIPSPLI